jgi:hypothetical protein
VSEVCTQVNAYGHAQLLRQPEMPKMLAGVPEDTACTQQQTGYLRPRRTCVWHQDACTWPVGSARREGKARTMHHACILDADPDAAASLDPAHIVRNGQVDARVGHEGLVPEDTASVVCNLGPA